MQREVIVKMVPKTENTKQQMAFVESLAGCLNDYRPRVVLDCSGLDSIDRSSILLLLYCLEEALKRNGDVRLAAISPGAKTELKNAKVDRLFHIFGSMAEAVESYDRSIAEYALIGETRGNKSQSEENAA